MQTTASLLRAALDTRDGALALTLDRRFQGLPDTAHGGSVLGALDLVADLAGPRAITGVYRRRVPLGAPLGLTVTRADGLAYAVRDDSAVLVEGHVTPTATEAPTAPSHAGGGMPLPVSGMCFACGADNTIGLRARLAHDDATVHGRWVPDERFAEADGTIATVALTTLLDEAAFWLGVLASGEAGMTTDLRTILYRRPSATRPVTIVGRRGDVVPLPLDERYWTTSVAAIDDDGAVIASAEITFVAVHGAARRLVRGLLATNSPALLRAVFPRYVETA